jgi:hypothetical protein
MTMDRLIRRIDGFLGVRRPSNIKGSLKTKLSSESDVQALSGACDKSNMSVGLNLLFPVYFVCTYEDDSSSGMPVNRYLLERIWFSPSFSLTRRGEWDVDTEKIWHAAMLSPGDVYLSHIDGDEFHLKPREDSPNALVQVFCKAS